jgi:HK97 family phage major capsid protein
MNKRLQEIELRLGVIEGEIENDDADLDALDIEVKSLKTEKDKIEKRQQIAAGISSGTIESRTIAKPATATMFDFDRESVASAPEYRSAYLKRLQGKTLNEIEQRALTTGTGSAGAAVPTTTLDLVIQKLRQFSVLFPLVKVSYVPSNLTLVVANALNSATWKPEGVAGTVADDTVTSINLTGFELIKLVQISAAADAMTIDAFEEYIADQLGRQMSIAIENSILNGTGAGQATGILTGVTWDVTNSNTYSKTNGIGYNDFVGARALLGTMYRNNGVWVFNGQAEAAVMLIKDGYGRPLFNADPAGSFPGKILGNPYIVNDYCPVDTFLFGCFDYYYMNFTKAPQIDVSREAAFTSGMLTYRGLAVADGKPALSEAFIKLTRSLT